MPGMLGPVEPQREWPAVPEKVPPPRLCLGHVGADDELVAGAAVCHRDAEAASGTPSDIAEHRNVAVQQSAEACRSAHRGYRRVQRRGAHQKPSKRFGYFGHDGYQRAASSRACRTGHGFPAFGFRQLARRADDQSTTTRRLSDEIEYSQPVLYKHFSGMDNLAAAVAIDGFGELAEVLSGARRGRRTPNATLKRIAHAYIEFAEKNPALYDAMFTRATTLRFADADTPPELSEAFAELRQAVADIADRQDADTLAEVLWAALHGLVALNRASRLRPGQRSARIELLVDQFTHAP